MIPTVVTTYALLFVLTVFGGGIATFGIGLALHSTQLNIFAVIATIVAAYTVGDVAYYCIGRFATQAFHTRFTRLRAKRAKQLEMVQTYYTQHGAQTLFLGKMSEVLAIPAIIVSGVVKMPFIVFMSVSIPTSLIKTIIILLAGYFIGQSADPTNAYFAVYGVGGLFLIAFLVFFMRHFYMIIKKSV